MATTESSGSGVNENGEDHQTLGVVLREFLAARFCLRRRQAIPSHGRGSGSHKGSWKFRINIRQFLNKK